MKTEWQIQMDFEKAMQAAEKLRGVAQKMDGNASDMSSTINSIDSNWDGENSDLFLEKGRRVQGNITLTAEGIRKVVNSIETIATRTRDAELAAIRIADD